jgi:hypothetical protein
VDLSGWTLAGSVQLTFPQGTALAGRSYIVVASVPGTLAAEVPAGVPVLGWEQGDLSQGSLILAAPSVSGSVPVARADISEEARSASLELVHPGLPAALPRAWRPAATATGTPGARNSRFTEEPLVLEEIPARGESAAGLTEISVTFSREVSGVAARDLTVDGVAALAVTGSGAGPYVFIVAPRHPGPAHVVLSEGSVESLDQVPFPGDVWTYFDPAPAVLGMPDNAQGGPGSTVQVPISVAPGDGIFGIDMTLTYAPAVLQAQSVAVSGIAVGQSFALAANLGTPGTIVISEYATQSALQGSGEIARIQFQVLGAPGATSVLDWTSASINENGIPAAFDPGLFTVTCAGAANGTACNDGNPCTASDQCQGGACTGTIPLTVPAEVANVRFEADKTTLRWNSAAGAGPGTVHDALRGLVTQLPVGSGAAESCLASGIVNDFTSDPSAPATAAAHWYLVRGRNACGTGTYGFRTSGGVPVAERTSSDCP